MGSVSQTSAEEWVFIVFKLPTGKSFLKKFSKSVLCQKSEFFEAFLLHSTPLALNDSSLAEENLSNEGLQAYYLIVQTSDTSALLSLIQYLQEEPLILRKETLAGFMIQADAWCLQKLFPNIKFFLLCVFQDIMKKKFPSETLERKRILAIIIEVLHFLQAANDYGIMVWSRRSFSNISTKCIDWLVDNFYEVAALRSFLRLSPMFQEAVVFGYYSRQVSEKIAWRLTTFCRPSLSNALPSKEAMMSFVRRLRDAARPWSTESDSGLLSDCIDWLAENIHKLEVRRIVHFLPPVFREAVLFHSKRNKCDFSIRSGKSVYSSLNSCVHWLRKNLDKVEIRRLFYILPPMFQDAVIPYFEVRRGKETNTEVDQTSEHANEFSTCTRYEMRPIFVAHYRSTYALISNMQEEIVNDNQNKSLLSLKKHHMKTPKKMTANSNSPKLKRNGWIEHRARYRSNSFQKIHR